MQAGGHEFDTPSEEAHSMVSSIMAMDGNSPLATASISVTPGMKPLPAHQRLVFTDPVAFRFVYR